MEYHKLLLFQYSSPYGTFDATWNLMWKSVILSSLNNFWVCRWYSWIQVGKEKHSCNLYSILSFEDFI